MNRIGPGTLLFCFFAVLAGLAGVYWWKKSHQPVAVPSKPAPKQQTYLVASTDLPAGRMIHPSDFMTVTISPEAMRARRWPALLMADGRQLVNRRLKLPRKQGDPFPPEAFYPEGVEADIVEQIEPGMRAVSISVSHEALPIKATPGVQVDVLFRTTEDEAHNVPELTTLLIENVRVLAIDHNSTPGTMTKSDKKIEKHLVTLAVSQAQALRMKTAEGHGDFSLSLRSMNQEDYSAVVPEQLTLAEVFQLPEPKPEAVPFVAEVFRRGQRRIVKFDDEANPSSSSNSQNSNKNSKQKRPSTPPRSTQGDEPTPADETETLAPDKARASKDVGDELTDAEAEDLQQPFFSGSGTGSIIVSTELEPSP